MCREEEHRQKVAVHLKRAVVPVEDTSNGFTPGTPTEMLSNVPSYVPATPVKPNQNKVAAGDTASTPMLEQSSSSAATPKTPAISPIERSEEPFVTATKKLYGDAERLVDELYKATPGSAEHKKLGEEVDKALIRAEKMASLRKARSDLTSSSVRLFDSSSNELVPLDESSARIDPALIGKDLSLHSSDAVESSGASSADLSAAAKAEEARALAAGVEALHSEEPSADTIDKEVSNLINDASIIAESASTSESSTSMSEEPSAGSMMLGPDSEKSEASKHESMELKGESKGHTFKEREGKLYFYKQLAGTQERHDMEQFFRDHEGLDLTPVYAGLKPKSKTAPYGTFITEKLEDGYQPMSDFIKTFKPADNEAKRQLRLSLYHAFSKIKGDWNDLTNANNIAVKSNPDGTFDIRFYEGGHFDEHQSNLTKHDRAIEYLKEFFGRHPKNLASKSFKRVYGTFL